LLTIAGNRRLRVVISENVEKYTAAKSKQEKGQVIIDIVNRLQRESPSGTGFVKLDPKLGKWLFIGVEKAKDKIGHALRKYTQGRSKKEEKKDLARIKKSLQQASSYCPSRPVNGGSSKSEILDKPGSRRRLGESMEHESPNFPDAPFSPIGGGHVQLNSSGVGSTPVGRNIFNIDGFQQSQGDNDASVTDLTSPQRAAFMDPSPLRRSRHPSENSPKPPPPLAPPPSFLPYPPLLPPPPYYYHPHLPPYYPPAPPPNGVAPPGYYPPYPPPYGFPPRSFGYSRRSPTGVDGHHAIYRGAPRGNDIGQPELESADPSSDDDDDVDNDRT
jgi:hypothetical protein